VGWGLFNTATIWQTQTSPPRSRLRIRNRVRSETARNSFVIGGEVVWVRIYAYANILIGTNQVKGVAQSVTFRKAQQKSHFRKLGSGL
jgi:hypothetical protein